MPKHRLATSIINSWVERVSERVGVIPTLTTLAYISILFSVGQLFSHFDGWCWRGKLATKKYSYCMSNTTSLL